MNMKFLYFDVEISIFCHCLSISKFVVTNERVGPILKMLVIAGSSLFSLACVVVSGDVEPGGSGGVCPKPRRISKCRTRRWNQDHQSLPRQTSKHTAAHTAAHRWPAYSTYTQKCILIFKLSRFFCI